MSDLLAVLENGSVTCGGVVVGSLSNDEDGPTLMLDLGWCKAAGLGVVVLGDRAVDKGRKPLVDR